MKNSVALVVILIFSASCANKKASSQQILNSQAWYLSIEKTECYGSCPSYVMEVNNNGMIRLNARRFMDLEGEFNSMLDTSTLGNVKRMSKHANWATYKSEYRSGYSDLPSTILRYSYVPGDTISVMYESDVAPKEILELGKQLDEIRKQSHWVSTIDE